MIDPEAQSMARPPTPVEPIDELVAVTVCGEVPSTALGRTSAHEHMVSDSSTRVWTPIQPHDRDVPGLPLTLPNLGRIRRDPQTSPGALRLDEDETVIEDLGGFTRYGGRTIVDCTNAGFGRDPVRLRRISAATGVNIIMGAGYYVESAHPADIDALTVEDCCASMIDDLTIGADGTDIRAGVIGEIGCSDHGIQINEEKALRAAAMAHQVTGAPIFVHPSVPYEKMALKVLDILDSEGVDLSRVVICHMDMTLSDPDYHKRVADRGCVLEFDRFGNEWYQDSWGDLWEPRDVDRIQAISWLVARGYGGQLTAGQDICFKLNWKKYGGLGYEHLFRRIEPMLAAAGLVPEVLDAIFTQTPRRLLAHRKPSR